MEIRVSGHQIDTGTALQDHAAERLNGIIDKYFNRAMSSQVTFGKAPTAAFACDIVMHVNNGLVLKSHAQAHDAHLSFDQAADKIEKQLRRYMKRLKEHKPGHDAAPVIEANAEYRVFAAADEEEPSDNPTIVAETKVDIPRANVADAVMMMDLRNTTALLFRNSNSGELNMVYRREDGNIGWVEPHGR
jgi:ribosomal subunit interface protein